MKIQVAKWGTPKKYLKKSYKDKKLLLLVIEIYELEIVVVLFLRSFVPTRRRKNLFFLFLIPI